MCIPKQYPTRRSSDLDSVRSVGYCFGIHIYISGKFLSELAVVIYKEYHIYILTNKPIYDITQ